MNRITWNDIADIADKLFNVWVGQPELRWAQESWTGLDASGLTNYETDLERHKVLIRLLVLADFYHQFCDSAYDETYEEDSLHYLCDELVTSAGLGSFRVGQLVGEGFCPDEECYDETELLNSGVRSLADDLRDETISALVTHFGSPEALFVALRLSREFDETICPDPKNLYLAGADFAELDAWENFEGRKFGSGPDRPGEVLPNFERATTFTAAARDCARSRLENARYIRDALPTLKVSSDLIEQVNAIVAKMISDDAIISEGIRRFTDRINSGTMHSREASVAAKQILGALWDGQSEMNGLINGIGMFASSDHNFGLLSILLTESGTNILNAYTIASDAAELL